MRNKVLAELSYGGDSLIFRVYCPVSGGFIVGTAKWRYNILESELPLVLEAIRYRDWTLFEQNSELDQSSALIQFQFTYSRFDKVEDWGAIVE